VDVPTADAVEEGMESACLYVGCNLYAQFCDKYTCLLCSFVDFKKKPYRPHICVLLMIAIRKYFRCTC